MQYDFTVAAGQSQVIEVAGSYFRYKNGTGPIRIIPSSGGYVDLLPGQGMEQVKFDRLTIKDLSGGNNAGAILAGNGAWKDERVTGTVDVVDGGKARTISGVAFAGAISSGAPVAAQYPHVQLWNGPGIGKNVIVKRVVILAQDAQQVTLVLAAFSVTNFGISLSSKSATGAASFSQMRYGNYAALQGAAGFLQAYMGANSNLVYDFVEPVVIPPGYGLILRGSLVNSVIGMSVETFEEAI